MHKSAMLRMKWFIDNYIPSDRYVRVMDIGSYDVNGSYRVLFSKMDNVEYIGLDLVDGPNVDYVPSNPYDWDGIEDGYLDFIISGNAFEHIEFPWLTMEQIAKKLKNGGFACILAPLTIGEHKHPVDCYRYFSDGFCALAKWAKLKVVDVSVGGIPDGKLTDEWINDNADDTMMIVTKNNNGNIECLPKMEGEVRLGWDSGWKKRYDFLKMWINNSDCPKIISSFLVENGYFNIYIYGWGQIGKMIYKSLVDMDDIKVVVIDQNAENITEINANKIGYRYAQNMNSCMLISVLDDGLKVMLDSEYPELPKYYVNELFGEKI